MTEKIIAIVANGEIIKRDLVEQALENVALIIAADAGAEVCRYTGITPDYIIGDYDSISRTTLEKFSNSKQVHLNDQYSTDMEKATKHALTFKPDRIRILSAFGKRIDHTFANLLFFSELNKKVPVEIFDNYGITSILEAGSHQINNKTGQLISFFAPGPILNLTLNGFRYPLNNKDFENWFVGISNVCESDDCLVRFDSGTLFMYEVLNAN
jgi:thiamine pyrophosphokinase